MGLGGQIVDFIRLHLFYHLEHAHGVAEVGVMEVEVGMPFEVGDALAEVDRRAADGAVHVIALLKKEFSEEGPVLSGDACD